MTERIEFIIDASAVIAALLREPGYEIAETRMLTGGILMINLAEVYQLLFRRGLSADAAGVIVDELQLSAIAADEELARDAGFIPSRMVRKGLSLADRFCLAEARRRGVPAVTTDQDWREVGGALGVQVELARPL